MQSTAQLAVGLAGGTRAKFFPQYALVSFPLIVATIVVFLCWFRRCRLNAEVFAPGTQKHSTGLAVGGWFIPLAMWWIPRRIALDAWRASGPPSGAWLIDAWWVAWLAKTLGAVIAMQFEARPNGYSLYDQVVGVVAGILAVLVIRQLTARQNAKFHSGLATSPFTRSTTF